jgi:peptide-methionine (S)-S-oxide reductase
VSQGNTGHVEAIEVTYDTAKVSYQKLLDTFWENVDPLDPYGQFCDKGEQYRAGIFYHDDEQKKLAEKSKDAVAKRMNAQVATVIKPASQFYPAEDYHQDFYIKNKTRYKMYRMGCGRDARLQELWRK